MSYKYEDSLLHWYPKTKDLGILTPKTSIIELNDKEREDYKGQDIDAFDYSRLVNEITRTIDSEYKLPVFLRTDFFSGKHLWKKTCYLSDINNLRDNLFELFCESVLADLFGLPLEAMIVREFIQMDTIFKAFYGEMPVNPERRYFIREGKVICRHPYWESKVFTRREGIEEKLPKNWRVLLAEANKETEKEINLLTEYSERVGKVLDGFWSVDFCKSKKGIWYLIDMALGEQSWHPPSCENSTMEEEPEVKIDFSNMLVRAGGE